MVIGFRTREVLWYVALALHIWDWRDFFSTVSFFEGSFRVPYTAYFHISPLLPVPIWFYILALLIISGVLVCVKFLVWENKEKYWTRLVMGSLFLAMLMYCGYVLV